MPATLRRRGGPPQPISGFLDLPPGSIPEAAEAIARVRALARERGERNPDPYVPSQPPPRPSAPADAEPSPNSPDDVGFTNPQTCEPAPAAGPRHIPKACGSCGAPIFWAQTESGRSMPVDATPVLDGNVVLYDHGGSIRARVLKKGEEPRPGEKRRTSHFQTCPHAPQHRRSR